MKTWLNRLAMAASLLTTALAAYSGEYAMVHEARRPEWVLVLPTEVKSPGKMASATASIEIIDIVCDGKDLQPEATPGHIDECPPEFPSGSGSVYILPAPKIILRKWVDGKWARNVILRYSLDPKSEIIEVRYRVHYWDGEQAKVSEVNKLTSYEWSALSAKQERELLRSK